MSTDVSVSLFCRRGRLGIPAAPCRARRASVKEALACRPELLFGTWDRRCLRLSCVNQPSNVSTLTTVSRSQGVKVSFSPAFLAPPRGLPPAQHLTTGKDPRDLNTHPHAPHLDFATFLDGPMRRLARSPKKDLQRPLFHLESSQRCSRNCTLV